MAETFLTVVGNEEPKLRFTLENNGAVIDLTNATSVELILVSDNTKAVVNSGHQSCTIVAPATSGVVDYTQNAGDFATPGAGRYVGEAKITYANGRGQRLHEQVIVIARDAES